MEWVVGDIIDVAAERNIQAIGFTANAIIRKDWALVMGDGAAKRVRDHFNVELQRIRQTVPQILGRSAYFEAGLRNAGFAEYCADYSPESHYSGLLPDYHLAPAIFVYDMVEYTVFAIQVKRRFTDHLQPETREPCFELARKSLYELAGWMKKFEYPRAVINCPLIGLGGFGGQAARVARMVEEELKDTDVIVCTLTPLL